METTTHVFLSNAHTGSTVFLPTISSVNMPQTSASVLDLNRIMTREDIKPNEQSDSPNQSRIFGSHIKEAVDIIKDWSRSGEK